MIIVAKYEPSTFFTTEMLIYPWMRSTAKSAYVICWGKKNLVHVCLRALPNTSFPQWTRNIKPISVSSTLVISVLLHPFQLCHCLWWSLLCKAHCKLSDIQGMELSFHMLVKHPKCPWIAVTQFVFGLRMWLAGVGKTHAAFPKSWGSLPRHNGLA